MSIAEAFNEFTKCSYSEDDFQWDLNQGEKTTTYFKAGWESSESEAKRLLAAIVAQYNLAPDGPLGKGFTNGPFLEAATFLNPALDFANLESGFDGVPDQFEKQFTNQGNV